MRMNSRMSLIPPYHLGLTYLLKKQAAFRRIIGVTYLNAPRSPRYLGPRGRVDALFSFPMIGCTVVLN